MSTSARISAFLAALAVLFGAGFGVGKVFDDEPATYRVTAEYVPGLLSLTVFENADVLLEYDVRHEKELHLIAVRKDFGDYLHLHPQFAGKGGWIVPKLDLSPGAWRLYADFKPKGGDATVVHDDLTVPDSAPGTAPAVRATGLRRTATVDGLTVRLIGDLVAGQESNLAFEVSRHGRWTPTEAYLGAPGHLVVIRDDDLGYLHAHPFTGAQGGPEPPVVFDVVVTAAGRYHLYFDFQIDETVHTAAFVVDAMPGSADHEDGMDHGDH